ncbi:MAG TPA: M28 family peptidase [Bryobacteraceae bacterium]|nr:M28 family peptidase [Bryobacteraceae bacterium]
MRIYLKSIEIALIASATLAGQSDISGERMRAHTRFLAHDLLEGRGVGERGGTLAEEYLAATLASFGVKPAGENGTYFQTVPMVGVTVDGQRSTMSAVKGDKQLALRWQHDYIGTTHTQLPEVPIDAEAVFVGHGIVSKTEKWDDYKGTDVRGKVVVLFTNEPQPENPQVFKGRTLTYAGRWVYKFEEAARQGAAGCIIIHTTPTAGYGWDVVRNSWGKEDPQMEFDPGRPALRFAGWVTEEAGGRLLSLSGHTVETLLKAADDPNFKSIPLGFRLRGQLVSSMRAIKSRNVLGRVEGSDPKGLTEAVLFSAHWDHLGKGIAVRNDAVYNGAIDNATGCAVVLEQARVWASLGQKPRRSALFAFWTAEESGLRGAEYFAAHPTIPAAKVAININYDALFPSARTRDAVVTGAERTTVWSMVQEAARRMELELSPDPRPEQGSFYRSDHFMLAKVGIPAFKVGLGTRVIGKPDDFSSKEYQDYNANRYHQPADEYRDDWDFASLEHAARFGFLLGLNIANATELPRWNPGDEFAVAGR